MWLLKHILHFLASVLLGLSLSLPNTLIVPVYLLPINTFCTCPRDCSMQSLLDRSTPESLPLSRISSMHILFLTYLFYIIPYLWFVWPIVLHLFREVLVLHFAWAQQSYNWEDNNMHLLLDYLFIYGIRGLKGNKIKAKTRGLLSAAEHLLFTLLFAYHLISSIPCEIDSLIILILQKEVYSLRKMYFPAPLSSPPSHSPPGLGSALPGAPHEFWQFLPTWKSGSTENCLISLVSKPWGKHKQLGPTCSHLKICDEKRQKYQH